LSLDEFLNLTDEQKQRIERALAAEHQLYHIMEAMKKGFLESEKVIPPDFAERMNAVKPLVVRAVYAIWNTEGRAATKPEIYKWVRKEVQNQIKQGSWKRNPDGTPYIPSYSTIDRCIRACCDPKHYPNQPTPIIRLVESRTKCSYMPNPNLFGEETKQKMLKIIQTR